MMVRMSDEDLRLSDEMIKWMIIDEKGYPIFKDGTPQEIIEIREKLIKKYSLFE